MNAYLPHDAPAAGLVVALLAATLALAFGVSRLRRVRLARPAAWALIVVATASVERLTAAEPAGFRMLVLIATLFLGMKAVVSAETGAAGQTLAPRHWLAFATLWPGMRPAPFAQAGGPALAGAADLALLAWKRLAAGCGLVFLARLAWMATESRTLATLLLLPGVSLILHFGVFNLLAALWRRLGVDCRPLFRAPLAARSLGDFWSRRWNLAFSEMLALGVYRPLEGRVGRRAATAVAFLTSGLLHEVAISVPVQAGYGLPSLYFALHGTLVLAERGLARHGRPVEKAGWQAHAWVIGWLALPLPLLFHPPFLDGVVWPLIGMQRSD